MRESGSSSEGSVSSFSSEDISYKQKFEKEKEKCLQLQVKLQGYHSVASQCPGLIKQNNILKQELKRLKGGHNQDKSFPEFLEQSHQGEKQRSESSSSFEVLNHHPLSDNDLVSDPHSELTQASHETSEPPRITNTLQQKQELKLPPSQNSLNQTKEGQQIGTVEHLVLNKDQIPRTSENKEQNTVGRGKQQTPSETLLFQNNSKSQAGNTLSSQSTTPTVHQTVLTPSNTLGWEVNSKKSTGMEAQEQSNTSAAPSGQPWGEGARPKNTNIIDWLQIDQENKLTSASDLKKYSDDEKLGNDISVWLRNNAENIQTSAINRQQANNTDRLGINPEANDIKVPTHMNGLTAENSLDTNEIYSQNQNANSEALPLNKPEMRSLKLDDLMSFSGLRTSSPPKSPSKGEDLGAKQQNQVVSFPTDDQEPQLASQAHSMVARFQSGAPTPAGMSSMLYEFAQTAAGMEKKITEYQSLIQRQQVQLQGLNQKTSTEEFQRLKEENKNLLALLRNQLAIPSKIEKQQTAVKSTGDADEMAQKVEELNHTNEQLFRANKEWQSKWQRLQQNTKEDKQSLEKLIKDLRGQVTSLSAEVEKLNSEMTTLDTQEQDAKAAKMKTIQKNFDLNQENLDISRDLEMLKTQVDELMRLKRRHEAEISSLKAQNRNEVQPVHARPAEAGEAVLLKQQLAVFHEDFQKERQDRTKAQAQAEKLRKERDAARMEQMNKMKKMQAMLIAKDEEINRKSRQVTDLQAQITSLRKEIHRERGKYQVTSSQHVLYPSGGPRSTMIATALSTALKEEQPQRHTYPIATHQQLSPEHLPNSWRCQECTFINFPERTVCDICGWQNVRGGSLNGDIYLSTGLPEVNSRGDYFNPTPSDVPDIVTD